MATKKWFENRKTGWWYMPVTFEGWLISIVYISLSVLLTIIYLIRLTDPLFHPIVSTVIYFVLLSFLTGALIGICYGTGEKPLLPWKRKPHN